jgi:hypothetical protein
MPCVTESFVFGWREGARYRTPPQIVYFRNHAVRAGKQLFLFQDFPSFIAFNRAATSP